MNIDDIELGVADLAAAPYDHKTFATSLFAAYGAPQVTVTKITKGTGNASDLDGGTLWRRQMHVLTCAPGEVEAALNRLAESAATTKHKVRFLLATDGTEIATRDRTEDDTRFFPFEELGNQFGIFLPVAGYSRFKAAEENPVDVKASVRLKRLHDALIDHNPEWAGDEKRHALHLFMTRVIFCLFAEDTGIFPQDLFARTIADRGGHAGEEMAALLTTAFTAMSTAPGPQRDAMPDWATAFEYVNGGLFRDAVEVPTFNRTAYRILCDAAANLNWRDINADIFGSMIQVIVDKEHRHETGLHYTSVPNILKVLDPLFLDDLRAEAARSALADASREKARLKAILTRLSKIRVFDPACGSGNFLVIAYQELRAVERTVLERLRDLTGQTPGLWSHVSLDQFFGIEIGDFAAETARLSLWIAKYQMDARHGDLFGAAPPALPLTDSGRIVRGNALRMDWTDVCPPPTIKRNRRVMVDLASDYEAMGEEEVPDEEAETFIVGNPPYLGFTYQTKEQKADVRAVFEGRTRTWKSMDLVACWFLIGSDYLREVPNAHCAFVATNSICQGQLVPMLWPAVLADGLAISFAHLSFKWANSAAHAAAVMCVIVGIGRDSGHSATLYDEGVSRNVPRINAYLVAGPDLYVENRSEPLSNVPPMLWGNKPSDGGNLILVPEERATLLAAHPEAKKLLRRFVGSQEVIKGVERHCLWITDDELESARGIEPIALRLSDVAKMRLDSKAESTRGYAKYPHRFRQVQGVARQSSIVVPKVSSERRHHLPVDYLTSSEIISDNAFALYDAPLWTLSLIASRLHLLWIETVCGKLKTDFRYSNTMGWHTFPVPTLTDADKDRLTTCAENILLARAEAGGTLAQLYDPKKMPDILREAHDANDATLERIYTGRPFRSDADRLNHLFRRYARMIAAEKGEEVAAEFAFDEEPAQ
ncbi:MAG: DNA methyltransferase [Pontixanthobacter sp.]